MVLTQGSHRTASTGPGRRGRLQQRLPRNNPDRPQGQRERMRMLDYVYTGVCMEFGELHGFLVEALPRACILPPFRAAGHVCLLYIAAHQYKPTVISLACVAASA
jgi:hypothetical protein